MAARPTKDLTKNFLTLPRLIAIAVVRRVTTLPLVPIPQIPTLEEAATAGDAMGEAEAVQDAVAGLIIRERVMAKTQSQLPQQPP